MYYEPERRGAGSPAGGDLEEGGRAARVRAPPRARSPATSIAMYYYYYDLSIIISGSSSSSSSSSSITNITMTVITIDI